MLSEQTHVQTPDGIVTLQDILEVFNQGNNIQVLGKQRNNLMDEVANTRISSSHDFIYIQITTGDILILTPDHRVYDPTTNEWVLAGAITKNTTVLSTDGDTCEIVDCHKIKDPVATRVITLSLSELDGFYANNILVRSN